jgi:hypothetical protein
MGWSRRPVLTPEMPQLYGRHLAGCLIVRLHVLPPEARHRGGTRHGCLTDAEFEDLHKQYRCNPPPADHHAGRHRPNDRGPSRRGSRHLDVNRTDLLILGVGTSSRTVRCGPCAGPTSQRARTGQALSSGLAAVTAEPHWPSTVCFSGRTYPKVPCNVRVSLGAAGGVSQSGGSLVGSLHLPRSCRHGPCGHRRG